MNKPTIEQNSVLNEEKNLIVSASAGSGKTTTMIQKVIKILKNDKKSDIRNILMLTFSRAAAAEMREKLIKKIYESGDKELEKQLDLIQFADIETIDSFCYKIVKKYFNFAGIDPTVEMGDASEIELLLSETYDRLREEKIKNQDKEFIILERNFKTNRNDNLLKNIVIDIFNYSKRMPESFGFLDKCINPPVDLLTNAYLKLCKLNIIAIKEFLIKAKEKLDYCILYDKDGVLNDYYQAYSDSLKYINSMYNAKSIDDYFENGKKLPVLETIRINKNRKDLLNEWDGAFIYEKASDVKEKINTLRNDILEDEEKFNFFVSRKGIDKTRNNLISFVVELDTKFKERKQKKNLISFDDCIILTLKVLSDDAIRNEVINIYKYIFIDEYQDTNYLQEQLLDSIVSKEGRNTLFAVGDIKQAIYHFRGAEPTIFLNREYKYLTNEEDGKKLTMATNFRSNVGILEFTNKVCSKIMIEETCDFNYDQDSELKKPNDINIESIGEAVEIYTCRKANQNVATNPDSVPIYSVKNDAGDVEQDRQAKFVADKIIELVDTAKINNQSVRYRDIAILLRKGSLFKKITDALKEKDIPFYSVKEQKNKSSEREILVDCIRLALNADQDIPLYNVLSSSIGGITRKEFMSLVREIKNESEKKPNKISLWESINGYLEDKIAKNKVNEFVNFINQLKDFSAYMTVSEIMTYILESGYDAFLMQKGEDVIAEINNFIQFVSTLSVNNDVSDFINYYDNVYDGNKASSAQDSVAIMTMHASKGLEFPIVILPYQEEKPNKVGFGKSNVALDKDLGCGYGIKPDEGDDYKFVSSFESEVINRVKESEERKEALRLMYVAFTRAQNKLILTAMVGDNIGLSSAYDNGISNINVVKFGLGDDWDLYTKEMPEEADFYSNKHKEIVIKEPVKSKDFDFSRLARKYKFENEIKTPVKVSVSNILRDENNYGATPFEVDINEKALLGTAIHSIMQNISYDLHDKEEVKNAISNLVEKGFIQREEADAIDPEIIYNALQSHVISMARENIARREQPFILFDNYKDFKKDSTSNEKVMIQGVIDLLIIKGNQCIVVDFKTGDKDVDESNLDYFKAKTKKTYKKQLDIYATAVEKILGYKVEQKIIYCMYTGTEIEV